MLQVCIKGVEEADGVLRQVFRVLLVLHCQVRVLKTLFIVFGRKETDRQEIVKQRVRTHAHTQKKNKEKERENKKGGKTS